MLLLHHKLLSQPTSKGLMQRRTYASYSAAPLSTETSLSGRPIRTSSCSGTGLFTAAKLEESLQRQGLQEQVRQH